MKLENENALDKPGPMKAGTNCRLLPPLLEYTQTSLADTSLARDEESFSGTCFSQPAMWYPLRDRFHPPGTTPPQGPSVPAEAAVQLSLALYEHKVTEASVSTHTEGALATASASTLSYDRSCNAYDDES